MAEVLTTVSLCCLVISNTNKTKKHKQISGVTWTTALIASQK